MKGGGEDGGGATEKTAGIGELAASGGIGELEGDVAACRLPAERRFWNGEDSRDAGVMARLCEDTGVVMTGEGASGDTA